MNLYLTVIPLILELMAAGVATVRFKEYSESKERYFLHLLWFTFIIEISAAVLKHGFDIEQNVLHKVYTVVCFMFYFYWYHSILKRSSFKKTAKIFAAIYLVIYVATIAFKNYFEDQAYAFVTGAFLVLILTFCHFYQLLRSDKVLKIRYKLSFWISTALLLFYIGIIPLMLLSEYLDLKGKVFILLFSLNVILYGCYIIGFLWTRKKYNLL